MAYQAQERIYVNRELTEIVPEDNPDGAILLVAEGGFLTDEDATAWGLAGTKKDQAAAETRPSPEQAAGNAQRIGDGDRDAASAKSVKGSKNKAQAGPDDTKAGDAPSGSGVTFSGGQSQNAVSGADAPAGDTQMLPKDLTAPGS